MMYLFAGYYWQQQFPQHNLQEILQVTEIHGEYGFLATNTRDSISLNLVHCCPIVSPYNLDDEQQTTDE